MELNKIIDELIARAEQKQYITLTEEDLAKLIEPPNILFNHCMKSNDLKTIAKYYGIKGHSRRKKHKIEQIIGHVV